MSTAPSLLLLQHADLLAKVREVAKLLKSDKVARDAFVSNPAGTIGPLFISGGENSVLADAWQNTNQFVLALFSNDKFRNELEAFVNREPGLVPSHEEVVSEFARLSAKHGDEILSYHASKAVGGPTIFPTVAVEFVVVLIYAVAAVVAAVAVGLAPNNIQGFSGKDALAIARQLQAAAKKARTSGALAPSK